MQPGNLLDLRRQGNPRRAGRQCRRLTATRSSATQTRRRPPAPRRHRHVPIVVRNNKHIITTPRAHHRHGVPMPASNHARRAPNSARVGLPTDIQPARNVPARVPHRPHGRRTAPGSRRHRSPARTRSSRSAAGPSRWTPGVRHSNIQQRHLLVSPASGPGSRDQHRAVPLFLRLRPLALQRRSYRSARRRSPRPAADRPQLRRKISLPRAGRTTGSHHRRRRLAEPPKRAGSRSDRRPGHRRPAILASKQQHSPDHRTRPRHLRIGAAGSERPGCATSSPRGDKPLADRLRRSPSHAPGCSLRGPRVGADDLHPGTATCWPRTYRS